MQDRRFMERTLTLAAKARGMTSPNPMVGAVITRNGRIIAEDYHRKPGSPHAEALTLEAAGEKARASTLYVNLEPCCHTDKRTPPCTKTIINAGIKRVVVAMVDPNPKVCGKGIDELRQAGIEVISGILEEKARKLNEFYTKYITTKRPFVILKVAMTLDGKIATDKGQSKWITGEKARNKVHAFRSSVDAVMTAIGTVKADNPELTARIRSGRHPKRVVIDPRLEIPLDARLLTIPPETIIVTKEIAEHRDKTRAGKLDYIERAGIKVLRFKERLGLPWLMERLGAMEITSVLVEGGASLNAHALGEGIVDKVMFFIAPKIIGGRESFPAVGGRRSRRLEDALRLRETSIGRVGDDFLVEGYL